jgi:ketosteroid isomerase-like protein
MQTNSRTDMVHNVFEAYRTKDRGLIEGLLAENFTFTSPYDDAIDRDEYFRRCWPNADRIREHVLERIVDSGEEVFVQYLCRTVDGKEFRNVEIFGFEGGRIASVEVYFGASCRDGRFQMQA